MRHAVYPGSFNPFHEGHIDILKKALKVFDEVTVAVGFNPEKEDRTRLSGRVRLVGGMIDELIADNPEYENKVIDVCYFTGLLKDFVKNKDAAIIRGLRNGHDLQYEMNQQYWNEDLGMTNPVVFFITDRSLSHISSSAIRMVNKINEQG